jgi:hypothetical protein
VTRTECFSEKCGNGYFNTVVDAKREKLMLLRIELPTISQGDKHLKKCINNV